MLLFLKSLKQNHVVSVHEQTNKHLNVTFVTMNVHIFKSDIVNIASVHEWPKPFLCDICGYTCSRKGDMNKHVLSVHERTKSFRCDICGHTCSRKVDMNKHVLPVHEGKKPFKCVVTNKL